MKFKTGVSYSVGSDLITKNVDGASQYSKS